MSIGRTFLYLPSTAEAVSDKIKARISDGKTKAIGPLQDPVTWYGINYTGLPKQRKVRLDW